MAEYSKLAKGNVITTGGALQIVLPFQPDRVELFNYTAMATPTSPQVVKAWWDASMGQGFAAYDYYASGPVYSTGVLTSGGISTYYAGMALQFGPSQQVIGATAANPIVFNVANHGYAVGDVVVFQGLFQSPTTGMPQISGMPFVITAVADANHFTIGWNGSGSNYTALSGSPAGAMVKKVLYPFLYVPGVSFISAISLGSTTTVTTTDPHNLSLGSEVAFRISPPWGTYQLNSLPNNVIPGSPIYGFVQQVVSATQVVVNINSSSFTAFNVNQPVASVNGLEFPQMVAVGDVNTGATQYSGGALYPSPVVNGYSTINGPAIQGSFINNTNQGFIIGAGLAGVASQQIYWRAFLDDYIAN